MLRFIINRLIAMVLTLWAVSVVAFAIIQLPPGDYLTTYVATLNSNGDRVDPSTIEALRQQYGFGEPFLVQYWKWISGIVGSGDFGQSFEWKAPVTTLIWGRLGNSILVEGLAVVAMWTIALPIGIYAAVRKYSLGDYLATIGGFIGLAVPNFLMALVLMYLSFVWFGTTIGGLFSPEFENAHWSLPRIWDFLSRAWAPVLVLATAGTAELIRILRANLLDELKKPYVTTARAKGLHERLVVVRHSLKGAMMPVVSYLGPATAAVMTGSVVIETIFGVPGIGTYFVNAALNRDYPLVMGVVIVYAVLIMLLNLVVDLLYAVLDPKVRYS